MKEKAKDFILFGIHATNFQRKSSLGLLPFNIILCMIAVLLLRNTYFIIFISITVLIAVISSVIYYKKWSVIVGFISQATQLFLFSIILDSLCFAMYHFCNLFILSEFLIFISLQLAVLAVCIPLNLYYYKVFKDKRKIKKSIVVGSIAGVIYEMSMIICKIYLTEVSLGIIVTIISLLINLIIYLLIFVIVMAVFRLHLIFKYSLNTELNELAFTTKL